VKPLHKISVVTPSYNQGKFLETTILSVIDQGYPNLEYIIIDGGSEDGTVAILNKYSHRIHYWTSEKDLGQAHAINKGFAKSTGDIMGWINSDDYFAPKTLWRVSDAFTLEAPMMVWGYVFNINHERKISNKNHLRYKDLLFGNLSLPQPSVFWNRTLWNAISEKLHVELYYMPDYELFLRMLRLEPRIVTLDDVLAFNRIHENTKTYHLQSKPLMKERALVKVQHCEQTKMNFLAYLVRSYFYCLFNSIPIGLARFRIRGGHRVQRVSSMGSVSVLSKKTFLRLLRLFATLVNPQGGIWYLVEAKVRRLFLGTAHQ
jgi:glycosyltransferase involved in cell wall biosynthesis